jgi:peptidoglycan/LPS O-acetylase OafA/YrhL
MILATKGQVLDYFLSNFSTSQLFAATFLLQAWHPDIKVVWALNGPAWSISVEMFFYAMFPLLCGKALKSPLSPVYFGAAITGAWLTAIWLYMPGGNFMALAVTNPLARILEFSVGVSAYECFTQSKWRSHSGTFLELAALALASLSVASAPIISSFVSARLGMHLSWWLRSSASFLPFAILIGIFSWQEGKVSRIVGWKPVVYLGEISFALYLVHQPLISYLSGLPPWFKQLPLPIQVLVFAIIVIGLSSALHHLVEKPCMDIAKRLILRSKDCMRLSPTTDEGR